MGFVAALKCGRPFATRLCYFYPLKEARAHLAPMCELGLLETIRPGIQSGYLPSPIAYILASSAYTDR